MDIIERALRSDNDEVRILRHGWWEAEMAVPAHRFYTWVHCPTGQNLNLLLISRDENDRQYAQDVLAFVTPRLEESHLDRPLTKFTGFRHASYPLDTVCAINWQVHRQFESEIDLRTLVVFPAYDCEFSGDEDAEAADAQRRLVEAIWWKHAVHPKAQAAFPRRRPQGRYLGPKPRASPIPELFWSLYGLPRAEPRRIAHLVNFRQDSCFVEARDNTYSVQLEDGAEPVVDAAWSTAKEWVWRFLAPGWPLREDLAGSNQT